MALAATAKNNEVLEAQLTVSEMVYTAEAERLLKESEEYSEAASVTSVAASRRVLEIASENDSLRAELKRRDEEICRQSVLVRDLETDCGMLTRLLDLRLEVVRVREVTQGGQGEMI